jgi:hypothetical protein
VVQKDKVRSNPSGSIRPATGAAKQDSRPFGGWPTHDWGGVTPFVVLSTPMFVSFVRRSERYCLRIPMQGNISFVHFRIQIDCCRDLRCVRTSVGPLSTSVDTTDVISYRFTVNKISSMLLPRIHSPLPVQNSTRSAMTAPVTNVSSPRVRFPTTPHCVVIVR